MSEDEPYLYDAVAFVDDFSPHELQTLFPGAQGGGQQVRQPIGEAGELFAYSFGAVVFCNVPRERREQELSRLRAVRPQLRTEVVRESYRVRVAPAAPIGVRDGALWVDQLSPSRSEVVALTVAQSAAMEYYESIAERLFARLSEWVGLLEKHGTIPVRTRRLHRFIAEAVGSRNEILAVLHLLDRPDAVWDDPGLGRIYGDLRAEFDLGERYDAVVAKLGAIQESLVLILDVARDRRLVLLEIAVLGLIALEIALGLLQLL